MELSEHLKRLQTGHICMVICCIIYLIWWSITFNLMKSFSTIPKFILFFGILISAIAGLVCLIGTMRNLPAVNRSIPNSVIILIGFVLYVLLLYLTSHFLHRQVTTELLLIVSWMVLELCVLSSTYGASAIHFIITVIMTAVVIVAAVISMICYLMYYNLEPVIGFYDGMIPLILFGVVMVIQVILIKA